jgi:hypothetical protein
MLSTFPKVGDQVLHKLHGDRIKWPHFVDEIDIEKGTIVTRCHYSDDRYSHEITDKCYFDFPTDKAEIAKLFKTCDKYSNKYRKY